MIKVLIDNHDFPAHFEILESVIVGYKKLFGLDESVESNVEVYLNCAPNALFLNYIKNRFPFLKIGKINDYDYYVNTTFYPNECNTSLIDKNSNSNKKYIVHNVNKIPPIFQNNPNFYYLCPFPGYNLFETYHLPFSNLKQKVDIPIYVVQGNLCPKRRNYSLLVEILKCQYKHNFLFKLIGRGSLPKELIPFKSKIVLKNNLNFVDYHKEFLNAYCILPLIMKSSHPAYYNNKLTSSINYSKGYNLKCLIDKDLQDIYNLSNAEVFNNKNDIVDAFKRTLNDFYKK